MNTIALISVSTSLHIAYLCKILWIEGTTHRGRLSPAAEAVGLEKKANVILDARDYQGTQATKHWEGLHTTGHSHDGLPAGKVCDLGWRPFSDGPDPETVVPTPLGPHMHEGVIEGGIDVGHA